MNSTGSLFSQILSLFQRSEYARHVKELKVEQRAIEPSGSHTYTMQALV